MEIPLCCIPLQPAEKKNKKVGEKFGRVKKNAYLCTVDENARMLSEYVGEGAMPMNIIRCKRKTLRDNEDSGFER